MERHVRFLLVEDSTDDEELILRALHRSGYTTEHLRVEDLEAVIPSAGLDWDVILCDYHLPGFSALDVLHHLSADPTAPPVVVISGRTGESLAVEMIQAGASDYVLKDNLERLSLGVDRAVREGRSRAAKLRAEAQVVRLNRIHQVHSSVNKAIFRVQDSQDLLQEVCGIATRFGHYAYVRVTRDQDGHLATVASSRAMHLELQDPALSLERKALEKQYQGSSGPLIFNETATSAGVDHEFYHSGGIFPLVVGGRVWGLLSVYSLQKEILNREEIAMVQELAEDLAWALESRVRDQQRHDSNQFLQDMTSLVPGLFYKLQLTVERHWKFLYVSPGIDLFLPFTPDEVLTDAARFLEAIHHQDRDRYWDAMERSARNLTVFSLEFRLVRPNGAVVWTMATSFPQRLDDASIVWTGLAIDVTPQNKLQEALQREQELLKVTLENIGDGVMVIGEEGRVVLINRTAELLLHWSTAQTIGRHWSELRSRLPWEALDTLTPWSLTPEDGSQLLLETHVSRLLDREGTERGRVMLLRDVTQREKIEERLRQSEKLESVGLLAGGIAHDFNNLLTGVFGFLQLARLYSEESDKVQQYLDAALGPFERARALTQQLLTFAKGGQPSRHPLQVEDQVRASLEFLLADSGVQWSLEREETPWTIVANEGQIGQVLENLILNARQVLTREKGRITVRLSNRELADGSPLDLPSGRYLVVEVADNGPGIPANVLPRIFDPFFTTKPTGTGLGLSICFSVVKKHHGVLEVETVPDQGSLFRIYLPASGDVASGDVASGDVASNP